MNKRPTLIQLIQDIKVVFMINMGDMVLEFASEAYKFTSPSSRKFSSLICNSAIFTMKPLYKVFFRKPKSCLNKLNGNQVNSVRLNVIAC